MSCRAVRAHMLDVARRGTSEAVSLEIEAHIEACAACEAERARWRLFGVVKDAPTASLGEAAERRILTHLLAVAPGAVTAPARGRWRRPVVAVVCATALAVAGIAALRLARPAPTFADGQRIEATAPGEVAFGGAQIRYDGHARMTLRPGTRTLVLSAGEADIEVTPGLPGHFRVVTPRFVVEVLGTRFVVDMQSVRTLRGRVHVLDGAGDELAVLSAGARWNLSEGRPAAGTSPVVSPEAAAGAPSTPEPAGPTDAPPGPATQAPSPPAAMGELRPRGATQRKQPVPAAELLTRSRAALARGDARQARALAQHALASAPSDRELAAGHLLLADSLLVDGRPGDAVEAYRRVVKRWSRAPEAELAQFAIGQLLMERGAKAEAAVAFNDYLARFPLGRFVREAREHLALLRSGP